ncbi:MAG: class I SAM-dependent methyltransferase [Actinomycetota bacterium]
MAGAGYLFENEAPTAGDRFDALATLLDPWTIGHLERLGVGEGWRCLEVGAGGGSVAGWLAGRVASSGHVLATDLDVRWLEPRLRGPNVEVRQHDVAADQLPEGEFDLVHERLVLIHVPERESVLRRLVAALRPGGWLLAEDFDVGLVTNAWVKPGSDPDDVQNRIVRGIQSLLRQRGADPTWAHQLPDLFRDAGLEQVGAVGYQVIDGGDATRALFRANVVQASDQLIAQDLIAKDELDGFLGRLDAGEVDPTTPLLVSAWGRRPDDDQGEAPPRALTLGGRTSSSRSG